jgi:hypothetical protein
VRTTEPAEVFSQRCIVLAVLIEPEVSVHVGRLVARAAGTADEAQQ